MPSWREQLKDYRDRWLIGVAVALSLLLHLGLIAVFFFGVVDLGSKYHPEDTIDFDLQDMAALEQALKDGAQPDRMAYDKLPPTATTPARPDAYGFQDHDAGEPSHRADLPINEFDRRVGPHGPGASPRPSTGRAAPKIPGVGEGVGATEPSDTGAPGGPAERGAESDTARSVDDMLARTGMGTPPSGGGEDGINPYNPDVGKAGKSVSISTKQLRYMGYFSQMREKIYLAWVYPQAAQRSGQQGIVFLNFTIARSGQVTDADVTQSSGYRLLDQYALKAVREAGFSTFPTHWPEDKLTVAASFHYRLVGTRAIH